MKLIQKITSIFLAAIFLLSSLGFTANKMACMKSGKAMFSFVPLEDCCNKSEEKANDNCCDEKTSENPSGSLSYFSEPDCCDIHNTSFSLSDFQSSTKNNIPQPANFDLCQLAYFDLIDQKNDQKYTQTSGLITPFTLHGRSLLHHISILTI